MTQSNYYAYNIIDAIYYNKPLTEEEMINIYGKKFYRRNELHDLSENEFNEQEKEFIQTIINKYSLDNNYKSSFHSYISKYENDNNDDNSTYVYAYAYAYLPYGYMPIQVPNMLSNVNGIHLYKLLSAKDIDYDNVILPNSIVTNNSWGTFDQARRWGNGKPIRINNTFELLNVIDYLLCACNNIWNELNKMKYSENTSADLWFVSDVNHPDMILSSRQISSEDFKISDMVEKTITVLNPFEYYTTVDLPGFGIGTNVHKEENDADDLTFVRNTKEPNNYNKNIQQSNVLHEYSINIFNTENNEYINGELQNVYGFQIGDQLKLYPGPQIDTFLNKIVITKNNIPNYIDFENKKLKNDLYILINDIEYKQLFIEFFKPIQGLDNFYILYYITNENKKCIIYYNNDDNDPVIDEIIRGNSASALIFKYADTYQYTGAIDEIYVINSEYKIELEVTTPTTHKFSSTVNNIIIYYYKRDNNLSGNLYKINKETNEKQYINTSIDNNLSNGILYNYPRYNIISGQTTYFEFDASYIARTYLDIDNNELKTENPLNIKLDDEWEDIMFFNSDNLVNVNIDDNTYYQFTGFDETTSQRQYELLTQSNFVESVSNYKMTNTKNKAFYHTWVKNEHPYQIIPEFDNNYVLLQDTNETIVDEINSIITNNELKQTTYNTFEFNHNLSENIEELKFNINFKINNTSKVNSASCTFPININKIYSPVINFIGQDITNKEIVKYSDNDLYPIDCYDNNSNINQQIQNLGDIYKTYSIAQYKYTNDIGLNKIGNPQNTHICDIVNLLNYNNDPSENDLSDINNIKTYDMTTTTYNIFNISYNNNYSYVNLLGSYYCLNNSKFNHNISLAKLDNTDIVEINSTYKYLFNINGFNKNYRLHGINNNCQLPGQSIAKWKTLSTYYDIYSLSLVNNYNSIGDNLMVKISDYDNSSYYQTEKIKYDNQNWEYNDGELHPITKTNQNYYKFETNPIDVISSTYTIQSVDIYTSQKVTYHIPITYLNIKSSTFYPPIDSLPIERENSNLSYQYNLNDNEDIERYVKYVNSWGNASNLHPENYHPITISLKLKENFDNIPYFYESNEAKLRLNVLRKKPGTVQQNIATLENVTYIAINSRYYMSSILGVSGAVLPIGSYPEHTNIGFKFNENYINNLNKTTNILYPIPVDYNELTSQYTYNYNNEKIFNINKWKYRLESYKLNEEISPSEGADDQYLIEDNNYVLSSGIEYSLDLAYFHINNDFKNNFNDKLRYLTLEIKNPYLLASKNIEVGSVTITGLRTCIKPIARPYNTNYSTNIYEINYNGTTPNFEFFEYKNSCFTIMYRNNNNEFEYISQNVNTSENFETNYNKQFNIFYGESYELNINGYMFQLYTNNDENGHQFGLLFESEDSANNYIEQNLTQSQINE